MKIEERLNRLEVNQMLIVSMLTDIQKRLPKAVLDPIENPKVPKVDRDMWGEYVSMAREQTQVHDYAFPRASIALDCEYLARNAKATEENKKHFSELEQTAYEMGENYTQFNPFKGRSKLQKWLLKFKEKKDVTSPWDIIRRNG